jgi:hypothetical protein
MRDTLRIEREKERKLRAKAERERKVRERQEVMEAKEKGVREAVEASDAARRERLRVASSKVKGPDDKPTRFARVVKKSPPPLAEMYQGQPPRTDIAPLRLPQVLTRAVLLTVA